MVKCAAMEELLDTGILELHIEQWLVRGAFSRDTTIHRSDEADRDEGVDLQALGSSQHLCELEDGECEKKGKEVNDEGR